MSTPRETKEERLHFLKVQKAERGYFRQLNAIVRHIGRLVGMFDPTSQEDLTTLSRLLTGYSRIIRPWAGKVAQKMVLDVSRRNEAAWMAHSKDMGREIRDLIRSAPEGVAMQELVKGNVDLITSLPQDAGLRIQKLAQEALSSGSRGSEIVQEIMRSGEVTRSRAECIARTEVGRASTTLVQTRAQALGWNEYIWRSTEDARVRPLHAKLNGTVQRWDSPPICESLKGGPVRAHPGCVWNCRCVAEPIIPDGL